LSKGLLVGSYVGLVYECDLGRVCLPELRRVQNPAVELMEHLRPILRNQPPPSATHSTNAAQPPAPAVRVCNSATHIRLILALLQYKSYSTTHRADTRLRFLDPAVRIIDMQPPSLRACIRWLGADLPPPHVPLQKPKPTQPVQPTLLQPLHPLAEHTAD